MAEGNGVMETTANNGAGAAAVDDAASRIKQENDDRRQTASRYRKRSRSRSPRRTGGPMAPKRDRRDDSRGGSGTNDRMVYISNLPYETRWMELKSLIVEKCGDINFVEILENQHGKSKGCAVVEFKHRDGVMKCCSEAMNRVQIKDRNIVCKEIRDPVAFFRKVKEDTGIDFLASGSGRNLMGGGGGGRMGGGGMMGSGHMGRDGGRGGMGGGAPPQPTYDTYGLSPAFLRQLHIEGPLCNRVFVANLAYNVQTGRVYEVFGLAGDVKKVDLQLDKEGKSKGLAVVEFKHPIEAVQAVSMLHDQKLAGRSLIVKMDRHEKHAEKRPGELPRDLEGVGMGLGANGAPLTNVAQLLNQVGGGATGLNNTEPPPRVFLDEQPRSLVNEPYGVGPPPSIMYDRRDTQQGFGGVSLVGGGGGVPPPYPQQQQQQQQQSALPLPPSMMNLGGGGGGSGYSASYATSGDRGGAGGGGVFDGGRQQQQQAAMDAMVSRGLVDERMANAAIGGRLPLPPLDYGGVDNRGGGVPNVRGPPVGVGPPPLCKAIVIRNLPFDYTWQMVRDRLRDYGNIEFADIVNPGVARVRFGRVDEAERARGN